ncbi:MAG: acylphosphatase [Chloroflexi bacterium]|nr:MAG: acylphosphatase [Chloroflexota bacterium]
MSEPPAGPDGLERLEAVVRGRVQGVGFRYYVLGLAYRADLRGWVANESDGTVRCVAEGPRPALEALLAALREGPPGARVASVDESWLAATDSFDGFGVRSAGHRGD